jgi:hypothetical protein
MYKYYRSIDKLMISSINRAGQSASSFSTIAGFQLDHLTEVDYKKMPWKNGLGTTTEIAISLPPPLPLSNNTNPSNKVVSPLSAPLSSVPAAAAAAPFKWRVSRAKVASDGPFSLFPNIDRSLIVLPGGGAGIAMKSKNASNGEVSEHSLLPLQPVSDQP